MTEGYSAADLTNLAKDAAMGPIREVTPEKLRNIDPSQLRPICVNDFELALQKIRASANQENLERLQEFNRLYGELK